MCVSPDSEISMFSRFLRSAARVLRTGVFVALVALVAVGTVGLIIRGAMALGLVPTAVPAVAVVG